jgi:hypothetical protein
VSTSEFGSVDAADALTELDRLRRRTRRQRRGFWFPLILFGLLILASAPLYSVHETVSTTAENQADLTHYLRALGAMLKQDGDLRVRSTAPADAAVAACSIGPDPQVGDCGLTAAQTRQLRTLAPANPVFHPQTKQPSPARAALFWLVAGTAGYLLTAAFYRRRAIRRGVATSVRVYVTTGVGLLAAVAATTAASVFPLGNLVIRQMVPLVAIGIGLVILAYAERSFALAAVGTAFVAAILATSGINTTPTPLGPTYLALAFLTPYRLAFLGALLLAAGIAFAAAERVGHTAP